MSEVTVSEPEERGPEAEGVSGGAIELGELGWGPALAEAFEGLGEGERGEAGRVRAQHRGGYEIHTARGVVMTTVSGKTMRGWAGAELPIVGDWVTIERLQPEGAVVRAILPRRGKLARRAAGGGVEEQAIVANVDVALLVTALDDDFSPRRLERYAMMAREGGVRPVIALTKADLCADPSPQIAQAREVSPGIEVVTLSVRQGEGLDAVRALVGRGETMVLLGSSGVGKSTLLNALVGRSEAATNEVRADGKGRHTTTHRHLVPMPGGGVLIDTPGMRELGVLTGDEQAFETFGELDALVARCRFNDCQHQKEPGCALRAALESGAVTGERVGAYLKMQAEAAWVEAQRDLRARIEGKNRSKRMSRELSAALRRKGRA